MLNETEKKRKIQEKPEKDQEKKSAATSFFVLRLSLSHESLLPLVRSFRAVLVRPPFALRGGLAHSLTLGSNMGVFAFGERGPPILFCSVEAQIAVCGTTGYVEGT